MPIYINKNGQQAGPYEDHVVIDQLRSGHPLAAELSMGMSLDYEVAIEEGATMVRVGTALFGPRPDSPISSSGDG